MGELPHFVIVGSVLALAVFALAIFLFVRSRPAYKQTTQQVVVRKPGERFFGVPAPIRGEGKVHLEFAWLSQIAYESIPEAKRIRMSAGCADPGNALEGLGWSLWKDFDNAQFAHRIRKFHLRVQVWRNPSLEAVCVAFGGTVFRNIWDWISNLRWFIPFRDDEYTKVVTEVGPRFVAEFRSRRGEPGWDWLDRAKVYSTGHSLGGGLAQEFAYSLPEDEIVPRVSQVFAFDTSPVTGFFSVDRATRDKNKRVLKTDRIFERHEILAIVRSITNLFVPPSARSPEVRQIRYNLFPHQNAIKEHSIAEFACLLDVAQRRSTKDG